MIVDVVVILCMTLVLKLRPDVPFTMWLAVVGPLVGARAALSKRPQDPPPPPPDTPYRGDGPPPPANGASRKKAGLRLLFEGSGVFAILLAIGAFALSLLHPTSKA